MFIYLELLRFSNSINNCSEILKLTFLVFDIFPTPFGLYLIVKLFFNFLPNIKSNIFCVKTFKKVAHFLQQEKVILYNITFSVPQIIFCRQTACTTVDNIRTQSIVMKNRIYISSIVGCESVL